MKKQQILLVNGGEVFSSDVEYHVSLSQSELSLDYMRYHDSWKRSLQRDLGDDYDVLFSPMPNTSNAKYSEWKVVFDKVVKLLDNNVILIGHSLGGIFLAKYLSENNLPIEIKALILIAAPYDDEREESLGDFKITSGSPLVKFGRTLDKIYLLYSENDPIVPMVEMEEYLDLWIHAEPIIFEDKGHFNLDAFPELVGLIKTI